MTSWGVLAGRSLASLILRARTAGTARFAGLSAFSCGLAAAIAHPPFGLIVGLVGFSALCGLLDHADPTRPMASAFWRSWLAGCAYFAVSLWWVSEAFMVDVAAHGWQAPFAVGFLAAGLALLWGAAGLIYRLMAPLGPGRVLVFAATFALFEWLRGHILTGLPWNLPGNAWKAGGAISQFASLAGVYGLSLVTLGIAASLRLVTDPRAGRWRKLGPAIGVIGLVAIWSFGTLRLATPQPVASGPWVRIVQANVPQADKWDLRTFTDILQRYTQLTAQASGPRRPDIVVWSETAIPALVDDYMAPGTWTRAVIEDSLVPGQTLIFGVDREENDAIGRRDFNSLMVARRTRNGFQRLAVYDKHHLVPFGEYFPVDSLAEATGLKRLVHVGDGFTPGPPAAVIKAAGLPALAPMICYESLFPRAISDPHRDAAWIVNVSNDAWFGRTSGPLQHLNLASYRAIEEGLPMVRATPTGVSAMIDAYGRPLQTLGQGKEGVIDMILPVRAPQTLYQVLGDSLFWVVLSVMFYPAIVGNGASSEASGGGVRRAASSLLRRNNANPKPYAQREV